MPFERPDEKSQEQFDHLLAKGMKIIFNPEMSPKLIESATQKNNIVAGIKGTTEAIVTKLAEAATRSGKQIPREMLPELNIAIASQLGELIEAKTGEEVPEEVIAEAMGYMAEENFSNAIERGNRTPEDVAGIANEYASLAKELSGAGQTIEEGV